MRLPLATLLILFWLCADVAQARVPVPQATGYVTDQVGVIEPAEQARIQLLLARYEARTQQKLAVLLIPETQGEELEIFADRVLAGWKMDAAPRGGAILLWSAQGFVLIRAAGPALERLTADAQADILSRWVVPAFARGEAGIGIRQGMERMIALLEGGPASPAAVAAMAEAESSARVEVSGDAASSDQGTRSVGSDLGEATLPPWFVTGPEEVSQLLGGVSRNAWTGLGGWIGEADRQIAQLPVVTAAYVLHFRGERVEPEVHPVSVVAALVLIAAFAVSALLAAVRRFVSSLAIAGVLGGLALWGATGFTALAGLLVFLGLGSPVIVRVLGVLLRGADDSEREAPPLLQPIRSPRLGSATPVRPRNTVSSPTPPVRAALPTRPARSSPPVTLVAARKQRIDALIDLMGRIALTRLRSLRPFHAGIVLALFFFAPALAFLGLIGAVGYVAYRDGVVYELVDLVVADPVAAARLKQGLPRAPTGL